MAPPTESLPRRLAGLVGLALGAVFLGQSVVHCAMGAEIITENGCLDSAECAAGSLCVDGRCSELCVQHSDCPSGERCGPGFCVPAADIACSLPADCARVAGVHPECFIAECYSGECVYEVQASTVCGAESCQAGITYTERLCGSAGLCESGGVASSCSGFACAADASCRTMCQSDSHCEAGFRCEGGSGTCVTDLRAAGDACVPDGAPSERCVASASCVSGTCLTIDGGVCASNTLCLSGVCVAGQCASSPHGLGGACDESADCTTALDCAGPTGAKTCRRGEGEACSSNNDCGAGHCECDDADCTSRTCASVDCVCGYGASGACLFQMNGSSDPQDCDSTPNQCVSGSCQ